MTNSPIRITALAGGIGAAKFLLGLATVIRPEQITVIANTGDDIELFGLRVCPDIDTVTYTLAGVVSIERGWGISGDTFEWSRWLARYTDPPWFNLGDRDLATHFYRTGELRRGRSLTEVTDNIRRSLGVGSSIVPMTDAYTPTRVVTDEGEMHFQDYFVRRRCEPRVRSIEFENIQSARPAPGVVEAILEADVVIVCPSNPLISIGPILGVPGIRAALLATKATVVAITPILAGKAIKGPAAEMLRALGHEVSARGVAAIYSDLADLFVLDEVDAAARPSIEQMGLGVLVTETIMDTAEQKRQLAARVLDAIRPASGASV